MPKATNHPLLAVTGADSCWRRSTGQSAGTLARGRSSRRPGHFYFGRRPDIFCWLQQLSAKAEPQTGIEGVSSRPV